MTRAVVRAQATTHVIRTLALSLGVALLAPAGAAEGQTGTGRPVSLEEAIRVGAEQSEQVTMARAGVLRAEGQEMQTRSEMYPQLSTSLSYTRALASQFEGAFGVGPEDGDSTAPPPLPVCPEYVPDPTLPLEERVALIEGQFGCTAGGGLDFANLPFGRENTYQLGFSFSQNIYAGGRLRAQNRVARAGLETATISLREAEAQLALDVTQAYYDAVLSDQLLANAQATLGQAETTLRQATLARQVGTQPEFELLRAQVTRDNQRPVVIQRQADRELAYLRLKQLLNIPANEPIQLTSELRDGELPEGIEAASGAPVPPPVAPVVLPDTTIHRTAVDQALQAVTVEEGLLDVAKAQGRPSVRLTSQYGRIAFPTGYLPAWDETVADWTVGVSLSLPLFTGGRIRGGKKEAEANLLEARARLQQVRELAALDTRSAYQELASAQSVWEASAGTVGQAQRAYQIAEVRYREGISTQVELSDARILLQQAQANRAVAARNLQVARARVVLLPDLPLGATAAGVQQQPVQQQPPPAQAAPQQQAAGGAFTAIPGVGGL